MELTNLGFMTPAESFGIDEYWPEEWDELENILRDAITTDGVSLVEITLEYFRPERMKRSPT